MTNDSMDSRISRIESDLDHIRDIIEPIPASVNNALKKQAEMSERLAIANERIATHLEESKRYWGTIESIQNSISDINDRFHNIDKSVIVSIEAERSRINSIVETIYLIKKILVSVFVSLAGFIIWVVQRWIENKG